MIVRIVQLHIKSAHVALARERVREVAPKVRNFAGCHYLEILFDIHHAGRVVTYSHWESEAALNKYRDSEVFKTFWTAVKPLFETNAVARSMEAALRFPASDV